MPHGRDHHTKLKPNGDTDPRKRHSNSASQRGLSQDSKRRSAPEAKPKLQPCPNFTQAERDAMHLKYAIGTTVEVVFGLKQPKQLTQWVWFRGHVKIRSCLLGAYGHYISRYSGKLFWSGE